MTSLTLPKEPFPWGGGYGARPSPMRRNPIEGDKSIPVGIQWGTDDMGRGSIVFNADGIPPQNFSQIAAVYVDNILCGSDVQLLFPDSQFKLDIPAFSEGYFPVVTNTKRFYIVGLSVTNADQTFLQVLNYNPDPIAIAQSTFNSFTVNQPGIILTAAGSVILVAGNGVIFGAEINVAGVIGPAAAGFTISLQDNSAAPLLGVTDVRLAAPDLGIAQRRVLIIPPGANIKFVGPLRLSVTNISGPLTGGIAAANVFYRLL